MSIDIFKSKRIKVFRNGDIFSPARKMVISTRTFRNYEQFLHGLSMSVRLNSGAVRKLFTLGGKYVHGLDSLEDGGVYVASSGETFKRVPYPLESGEGKAPTREERIKASARVRKSAAISRPKTSPMNLLSKALRIVVFRNGGFNEPTGRLLVNHKNCKSFSQLLMLMSELIQFQNGQVRKVHDASSGMRITGFKEMYDGQNLVGIGYEPFKAGAYKTLKLQTNSQEKKPEEAQRKIVTLYPNGDSYHNGWTVSVKSSRFPTMKKLTEHLNKQISLVTGLIKWLYTLNGDRIMNIGDLQHGSSYVLVSGDDPFVYTDYNLNDIEVESPLAHGLAGSTTKNDLMGLIRRPYQPLYDPDSKSRPRTRRSGMNTAQSRVLSTAQSRAMSSSSRLNHNKSNIVFKPLSGISRPSSGNTNHSTVATSVYPQSVTKTQSNASIEEEDVVKATKETKDDKEEFESPTVQEFQNSKDVKADDKKSQLKFKETGPTDKKISPVEARAEQPKAIIANQNLQQGERPRTQGKSTVVAAQTEKERQELKALSSPSLVSEKSAPQENQAEALPKQKSEKKLFNLLPKTQKATPAASKSNIRAESAQPESLPGSTPLSRAGSEQEIPQKSVEKLKTPSKPASRAVSKSNLVQTQLSQSSIPDQQQRQQSAKNQRDRQSEKINGASVSRVMTTSSKFARSSSRPLSAEASGVDQVESALNHVQSNPDVTTKSNLTSQTNISKKLASTEKVTSKSRVKILDDHEVSNPTSRTVSQKPSRPQSGQASVNQQSIPNSSGNSRPTSAKLAASQMKLVNEAIEEEFTVNNTKSKSSVRLASNPVSVKNSQNLPNPPALPVNEEEY